MWGCLAPVVVIAVIALGALVYNTYYFTSGYKEAPGLPAVMTAVRSNPTAARILGRDIQIVQMLFNMPSNAKQNGHRVTYIVAVKGSKAEGRIQSSVLIEDSGTTIKNKERRISRGYHTRRSFVRGIFARDSSTLERWVPVASFRPITPGSLRRWATESEPIGPSANSVRRT